MLSFQFPIQLESIIVCYKIGPMKSMRIQKLADQKHTKKHAPHQESIYLPFALLLKSIIPAPIAEDLEEFGTKLGPEHA